MASFERLFTLAALLIAAGFSFSVRADDAVEPTGPKRHVYNALDAGRDAYDYHESVRRGRIAQQMDMNDYFAPRPAPWQTFLASPEPFDSPPVAADAVWNFPAPAPGVSRAAGPYRSVQIGPREIFYRPRAKADAASGKVVQQPAPLVEQPHPRDAEPRFTGPREF